MANYDDLVKEYKRLAKRADQRLVRLEAATVTKPSVLDWAYKKAMYHIEQFTGKKKGKMRFNVGIPKTEGLLKRKIEAIKQFLESPTSKISSIRKIEKQRIKALNEKAGAKLSMSEWMKLFETGKFEDLIDSYGSSTAVEAIGTMKKDAKKIEKLAKEADEQNISLSEKLKDDTDYDFVLREAIADILEKEGLDFNSLK